MTVSEHVPSHGRAGLSGPESATTPFASLGSVELLFTPRRFALLLGLLILAAYPGVLLGEHTFFHRDFGIYGYPLAHYHRECFWKGEIPLWNPLNNCGVPFLAQWNTMTLYPGSLFYLLFPLSWSLGVLGLAHLFLAGLGTYWLALRWTRNPLAAAVAGLIAAFNGFASYSLVWPQIVAALGWMPWVVGAAERAWQDGGWRKITTASLFGAMQMLTGAAEIILMTWLVAGALLASETFPRLLRRMRNSCTLTARFAAVVLLVAGLSAVQLLPFLELLANSQRNAGFLATDWALSWSGAATLLVPLFHTYPSFHGVAMQYSQQWVGSIYVGTLTLVLAPLAVAHRHRRAWILASIAIGGLLFALGEDGWIYEALRRSFPQFSAMRFPVKFMALPVFAFPLLGAFAIAHLRPLSESAKPSLDWRFLLASATLAALAIGLLLWTACSHPWPRDNWPATLRNGAERAVLLLVATASLIGLQRIRRISWQCILAPLLLVTLWIDLRTHAPNLTPTVARSVFDDDLQLEHLNLDPKPAPGHSRALVSPDALAKLRQTAVGTPGEEIVGRRMAMFGNLNLLDGLAKVNGFYPLYPREHEEILSLIYPAPASNLSGLLQFLGVSQVTAPDALMDWTPQRSFQPMATAGQKPIFADAPSTLTALVSAEFNPLEQVFLPNDSIGHIPVTNRTTAQILSQRIRSHQLELEVEAQEPSLVVVAQTWYPSWRAVVDGNPTTLWRANHAFQAVVVPAGKHLVTLRYEDRAFNRGAVITSLSLLACGLAWISSRRRAGDNSQHSM